MSYPEPTPILKGKDAEEFLRRLKTFHLTKKQKAFYKDAISLYRKMSPEHRSNGKQVGVAGNASGKGNGKAPSATDVLEIAVRRIVRLYRPTKIYLFGSFANGNPHPGSDLDLLIVKNTRQSPKARWMTVRRILRMLAGRMPISPLVYTEKEVAERLRLNDFFISGIVRDGVVIYG
jgi:uncharacterized protein